MIVGMNWAKSLKKICNEEETFVLSKTLAVWQGMDHDWLAMLLLAIG